VRSFQRSPANQDLISMTFPSRYLNSHILQVKRGPPSP
jgi:hypothetical protein